MWGLFWTFEPFGMSSVSPSLVNPFAPFWAFLSVWDPIEPECAVLSVSRSESFVFRGSGKPSYEPFWAAAQVNLFKVPGEPCWTPFRWSESLSRCNLINPFKVPCQNPFWASVSLSEPSEPFWTLLFLSPSRFNLSELVWGCLVSWSESFAFRGSCKSLWAPVS